MTNSTPTWYLQAEDGPEGPYPLNELKRLACHGGVLGTTRISPEPEGPWEPADSLKELELEWSIIPDDADALASCHVLALREWVENGDIEPYWNIKHLPTGETYDVVDALCSALLSQNKVLEVKLEALGPSGSLSGTEDKVLDDAVENLLRSLELKTVLLKESNRKILELKEERDEERDAHDKDMRVTRERLEELEAHLEEMDEAMAALTRRYRDLNDRFLRARSGQNAANG